MQNILKSTHAGVVKDFVENSHSEKYILRGQYIFEKKKKTLVFNFIFLQSFITLNEASGRIPESWLKALLGARRWFWHWKLNQLKAMALRVGSAWKCAEYTAIKTSQAPELPILQNTLDIITICTL